MYAAYHIISPACGWKPPRVTSTYSNDTSRRRVLFQGTWSAFCAELGNKEIAVLFCSDVKSPVLFLPTGNCTAWVLLPLPLSTIIAEYTFNPYFANVSCCKVFVTLKCKWTFIVCAAFHFSKCPNHMLDQQRAFESVPLGPMKSLAKGELKYIYFIIMPLWRKGPQVNCWKSSFSFKKVVDRTNTLFSHRFPQER